jgi:hypothetical protein
LFVNLQGILLWCAIDKRHWMLIDT